MRKVRLSRDMLKEVRQTRQTLKREEEVEDIDPDLEDIAANEAIEEVKKLREFKKDNRAKRFQIRDEKRSARKTLEEIKNSQSTSDEKIVKVVKEFFFMPGDFVVPKGAKTSMEIIPMGLVLETHDQVISRYKDKSPKKIIKGKSLSVLVNGAVETWQSRNVRYSKEN